MSDKNSFPQIPSTVWWGVRAIFQRTPSATVDERMLGVQLGVQDAAAKQYVMELRRAGILNEENKATPIAQRWRLDQSYAEAVQQILAATYPEGLLHVAPPGGADRQKIVNWFLHEGLGQGAASNKAATYLLISSREPNEAPSRGGGAKANMDTGGRATPKRSPTTRAGQATSARPPAPPIERQVPFNGNGQRFEPIPLNVNVQIHISADAGAEQIETIFSAMRRYLHDAPASALSASEDSQIGRVVRFSAHGSDSFCDRLA
jgi:hypothetical protein